VLNRKPNKWLPRKRLRQRGGKCICLYTKGGKLCFPPFVACYNFSDNAMFVRHKNKGFSLVEMMVVIGIIAMILGLLITSFLDARQNSRDRERVSDLAQIEFALNAYREFNRAYPDYNDGVAIGLGEEIDDQLRAFWDNSIEDPLNDDQYHYYFHSELECGSLRYVAIMAVNMERDGNSNVDEVCEGDIDREFENAFVVLIEGPLSEVGSSNYTSGNNQGQWWERAENQTWADLRYNWDTLIDWDEEEREAGYNACMDPTSDEFRQPYCRGCTDPAATNYNRNLHPDANDGSCTYAPSSNSSNSSSAGG